MISSIFVALPIYLASGAGFGFAWSRYVSVAARRNLRAAERARKAAAAQAQPPAADLRNLANVVEIEGANAPELGLPVREPVVPNPNLMIIMGMVLAVAFIWLFVFPTAPEGSPFAWEMIEFASILLGVAGGRWYARATNDRDKLIFLGSASFLFVVASLQYDLGILNGLTKFGAGSVSVEFTPQAAKPDTTPGLGSKDSFQAFPGASRLDVAISLFSQLGAYIESDEKYSQLFAGPNPGLVNTSSLGPMKMRLQAFKNYANKIIGPVANKLCFLQHYHRSENALIVDPKLVLNMRYIYQSALDVDIDDTLNFNIDGLSAGILKKSIANLENRISYEHKALRFLSDEGVDKSDYYKGCGDIQWQEDSNRVDNDADYLFSPVAKRDVEDNFAYFGYLAVMAATAEFAYGSRENAIQLLDREIRREGDSPILQEFPGSFQNCVNSGSKFDSCSFSNRARLDWFRRLFVVWRLEYIQNILIDASEDENDALVPINVTTLERSIAAGNLAFDHLSVDAVVKPDTLEGKFDFYPNAGCSVARSQNSIDVNLAGAQQLAVNAYSIIVDKNNELWILATHPEIVTAEPSRIATLDRYADEIVEFDTECLSKLQVPQARIWQRRRRLLGTVAAYWEAKGRRFGISVNDKDRTRQIGSGAAVEIAALCKADKANQLERRAFEMERYAAAENASVLGTKLDSHSALDLRVADFDRHAIEARIASAPPRMASALKQYAQGDIDKYCIK